MSRANPFDNENSKRKRIFNNISLGISTAVVVAFVLWVILNNPRTVRTKLDPTYSKPLVLSENVKQTCEFYELYELINNNQQVLLSEQFSAEFPIVSGLLLQDDSVWTYNKPYVIDTAGYFGLALCYTHSNRENINRMDVVLIPYQNRAGYLNIKPLIRYTVSFHKDYSTILREELKFSQYRLNFYNLQLKFTKDIQALEFKLKFNDVISEAESEKQDINRLVKVDDMNFAPALHHDKANSYLQHTSQFDKRQEVIVNLNFNDFLHDYFDGMEISLECAPNSEFSFLLN